MNRLLRLLNPATNAPGWTALIAAVYAVVQAAAYGHSVADPRVYLPVITAFLSLLTRQVVTPVADPRLPAPAAPKGTTP